MRKITLAGLVLLAAIGCGDLYAGYNLPDETDAGGLCAPGATAACYTGPPGTDRVGLCARGTATCNADGMSFGTCQGDVTPKLENCATPVDEDCDGGATACMGLPLWSKRFGGDADDQSNRIATTSTGDVIVTGGFSGNVNFGGGLLTSAGLRDLFIVKLDSATGEHRWSKRFGDHELQPGMVVAIDGGDNALITGGFSGTVDFGGGPLTAGPAGALFIAKLDDSGNLLWAKSFDNATAGVGPSLQQCTAIAAGTDSILVTGCFHDAVDFGGGPLVSTGETDIFVARFDHQGNYVWAKRFGDPSDQKSSGMALDGGGDVLVTGSFLGTIDFGGAPLAASPDGHSLYAARLDTSGAHVWSKRVGDAAKPQDNITLTADSSGNPIFTGSLRGVTDFGGGSLTSAGGVDVFSVKLDAEAAHVFSRRYGDGDDQKGLAVAVDGAGNGLITGAFEGTLEFGGGLLASAGAQDVFLAKLDAAGNHLWSKRFGDEFTQIGTSVAADKDGNTLLTGQFYGTVDFGNGPLDSAGSSDIFVAKFSP